MKVQSIVHACLLGCLLVAAAGCVGEVRNSAGPERVAAGYPIVVDSGVVLPGTIGRHGIKDIYWLDNERILFLAKEPDWVGPSGEKRDMFSLILWNWRTGKPLRHRGPGIDGLCVGDDIVRYYRRRVESGNYDDIERYAGRFGEEGIVPTVLIDRETCRPKSELPPLPAGVPEFENGRLRLLRLRPEHGFLEYSILPKPNDALRLIPPYAPVSDARLVTELRGESISAPAYFPFKQAYWIMPDYPEIPAPVGKEVRSWWLYPNGTVELVHRAVRRSDAEPNATVPEIPTKAGYYLIKPRNFRDNRIGQAGLYRYNDSGPHERMVRAEVSGWSVSPSGCRLALGLDRREIKSGPDVFVLNTGRSMSGGDAMTTRTTDELSKILLVACDQA